MPELSTPPLERSPTAPSLAPQPAGRVPAPDRRGPGGQRRSRQPVENTCPRRRSASAAPAAPAWCPAPVDRRATRPPPDTATARPRSLWLPGRALDPGPHRRGDSPHLGCFLPSHPERSRGQGAPLESPNARAARSPARRSGEGARARRDLACHQNGAGAPPPSLCFSEASGVSPLPSVVRT
jgi:hypothetical protein